MTTKAKHMKRSRRSHSNPRKRSMDYAFHELDVMLRPIYKIHRKKYDAKGKKLTAEDEI